MRRRKEGGGRLGGGGQAGRQKAGKKGLRSPATTFLPHTHAGRGLPLNLGRQMDRDRTFGKWKADSDLVDRGWKHVGHATSCSLLPMNWLTILLYLWELCMHLSNTLLPHTHLPSCLLKKRRASLPFPSFPPFLPVFLSAFCLFVSCISFYFSFYFAPLHFCDFCLSCTPFCYTHAILFLPASPSMNLSVSIHCLQAAWHLPSQAKPVSLPVEIPQHLAKRWHSHNFPHYLESFSSACLPHT